MAQKQKTTNWILPTRSKGCDDNQVANYGSGFDDFINKVRVVKLSLEEKSNGTFNENKRCKSVWTFGESVGNVVFFLHNLDHRTYVPDISMVSYELWVKLPTTQLWPEPTTHYLHWEEVVGIWYIEFETILLKSYKTSLDMCKDPSWKVNIAHK
jgi:hypothetical protein